MIFKGYVILYIYVGYERINCIDEFGMFCFEIFYCFFIRGKFIIIFIIDFK